MYDTLPGPKWPSTMYQLLQVEISLLQNFCESFVTSTVLNQFPCFLKLFELQSEFMQNEQTFQFYERACDWLKISVAMQLQITH